MGKRYGTERDMLMNEVTVKLDVFDSHEKQDLYQFGWHSCCLHRSSGTTKKNSKFTETEDIVAKLFHDLQKTNFTQPQLKNWRQFAFLHFHDIGDVPRNMHQPMVDL